MENNADVDDEKAEPDDNLYKDLVNLIQSGNKRAAKKVCVIYNCCILFFVYLKSHETPPGRLKNRTNLLQNEWYIKLCIYNR